MTSIGETLRRERTKRSLDLKTVSSELKISQKFLEAIEADAFDKLPGGMFTKSFVRQYARYLGLDEDDLVAELAPVVESAAPVGVALKPGTDIEVPKVAEWEVMTDRFSWSSSLPAFALVVVVMLVCSAVYSWWQRSRSAAQAAPVQTAQVQPVPTQPAPPQPAQPEPQPAITTPAPTTSAQPTPATTHPTGQPSPAVQSTTPQSVQPQAAPPPHAATGSADRPLSESGQPAATPANTPAPANGSAPTTTATPAAPSAGGPVHVELTASEPVWVLAQTDGKYSFSGTLEANETRIVEATGKVVLRLGNAGGVTITLNGKPIGTVGAKGQVKTIQLTSGGWTVALPKPSLPAVDDIL